MSEITDFDPEDIIAYEKVSTEDLAILGAGLRAKIREVITLNQALGFNKTDYWFFDLKPAARIITPEDERKPPKIGVFADKDLETKKCRALTMSIVHNNPGDEVPNSSTYYAFYFTKTAHELTRVTKASIDIDVYHPNEADVLDQISDDTDKPEDEKIDDHLANLKANCLMDVNMQLASYDCTKQDIEAIKALLDELVPYVPKQSTQLGKIAVFLYSPEDFESGIIFPPEELDS